MLKEKDALINIEKHKKIKTYRNKITDLLKTSKHAHYHKYFEENKKNWKALWIRINEIVYSKNKNETNSPLPLIQDGKTIADQNIVEHFNNFFTGIGKKLQTKRLSRSQMLFKIAATGVLQKRVFLKNFANFTGKYLCWNCWTDLQRRDSNTGVFL